MTSPQYVENVFTYEVEMWPLMNESKNKIQAVDLDHAGRYT